MDEKKRVLSHLDAIPWTSAYQQNWTTDPSLGVITKGSSLPVTSFETTSSRGHAWPSAARSLTDVGGNFTTSKITAFDSGLEFGSGKSRGYYYSGPQLATAPGTAIDYVLGLVKPSSEAKLMQMGTTAIARSIPTNPVADAATFIGELREGLPKAVGKELLKKKFKDYRKYGSEYINIEFGWKPIVSDLQKFGKAAIESDKILKQLERDSGKNIHRKFTFPDEISNNVDVVNSRQAWTGGISVYPYCFWSVTGDQLIINTKVETKTWFSGCYTYHLNLGNTLPERSARIAAEARKLFGIELTPETVWNLAPWSWAVDWEGNIGDTLHNVSRFGRDGLVLRYGYIMQQKTATMTYTLGPGGSLGSSAPRRLQMTLTAVSKVRRRATPFGFGFDMTALTGRQSAILGALGISRGPRHL